MLPDATLPVAMNFANPFNSECSSLIPLQFGTDQSLFLDPENKPSTIHSDDKLVVEPRSHFKLVDEEAVRILPLKLGSIE